MNPPVLAARLRRLETKDPLRHDALRTLFEEAGCNGRLTEQTVKKNRPGNLICELPGESASTVVVSAHFDFSHRGSGAVDDWSGASMLPSLYQGLAGQSRRHRFLFIGFTLEEEGLAGSRYFVEHLSGADRAAVRAMVNLECLGLGPPHIWASRADKQLAGMFGLVAHSLQMPFGGVNIQRVGDDDSHAFAGVKIPVLPIHSITQETLPLLHSGRDSLGAIDAGQYAATYKLVTVYLAYLDSQLP